MYFNAQGQAFKNMVSTTTFYKSSCERLPITWTSCMSTNGLTPSESPDENLIPTGFNRDLQKNMATVAERCIHGFATLATALDSSER